MANETTETVALPDVTDAELFREARDEPPKEAAETPAQAAERQRDEKGRFVKAQGEEPAAAPPPPAQTETPEAPAATTTPSTEADEHGRVPAGRMREATAAREAAETWAKQEAQRSFQMQAELQAMRDELKRMQTPKPEPVDFFANPDQAIQQHLSPIEQRFAKLEQDMRLATSRTAVIAEHGAAKVAEMEQAVQKAMQANHPDMAMLAMQMRASDNPANVAWQWYRNQRLMEATGGDPDAYKAKVLEEALKDPKYLEKALEYARNAAGTNGSRPAVNLPPSLNKATGSGGSQATDDGDMSDRALFKNAMAR